MPARRERRRTEDPAREPRSGQPAPPQPDPRTDVLALQRTAGNAAVAKLLRKGPQPQAPRQGGWNEQGRDVAGTVRIPVTGVKAGNQEEDVRGGSTEGAKGKAIVIVPDGADLAAAPDVLLFFHGMYNLGYRERTTDDASRGAKGTVHDVEADRIPQQLTGSGRNIVGVLPQGTNAAEFGIGDPQKYVAEVLALAAAQLPALRPGIKLPATITPGRIIAAGHSGGGRPAYAAARAMTRKAPENDEEWLKAPPLFLFDGINGPGEKDLVATMMEEWLAADRVRLKASGDPNKLLDRRGIRLRSTHTNSPTYTATNVGGGYDITRPSKVPGPDGKPTTETIRIDIPAKQSLKGRIDTWFAGNANLPGVDAAKWRAQYDVPQTAVSGGHEATVGTGKLETDAKQRVPTPAGVTGDSQKAGVPDGSGGGNLQDSLKGLPPDALRKPPPPPPPKTAMEEDGTENAEA